MGKFNYIVEVLDKSRRGWLEASYENMQKVFLPFSTKVSFVRNNKNSQTVKLMETTYAGQTIEIPYETGDRDSFSSFLSVKPLRFHKITIILNKKKGLLTFGKDSCKVIFDKELGVGLYEIGFPLMSSKMSSSYLDEERGGSRFATTWFPLSKNGKRLTNRFLHYGTFSNGCITIKHSQNFLENIWSRLFVYLMLSRDTRGGLAKLKVL